MKIVKAQSKIPDFVRHALWSYDVSQLDLVKHKSLLIKNILDYGTKQATDWLRCMYTKSDIQTVIKSTPESAWGKKSLNLWSLLYDVKPQHKTRFVG